jgi:hypothetical protein
LGNASGRNAIRHQVAENKKKPGLRGQAGLLRTPKRRNRR